jgi:miniconductance mechanosensitive channel
MIFSSDPTGWLKELFLETGMKQGLASFLSIIIIIASIGIISWIANLIAKAIILKVVTRIVKNSKNQWDDIFLEQKVFTRLSHFAPALTIWFMAGWALKSYTSWLSFVHSLTYIYMLFIGMIVINSFIESWHQIYQMLPIAKHRNIKGYVQLLKVFVVLVTVLIIISVVFKKEVSTLLAGIGVMASVLILVFRDTLVGVVASIQLSSNKMVKVGDWITIPRRDVDGVVTDITLNTVKVQNFDKTIMTVPTHVLVQDSFQNWIGMDEAGARRIKRPVYIDIKSIKFLDNGLKQRLLIVPELKEYIEAREVAGSPAGEGRQENNYPFFTYNRLTNLELFRFYGETWLKNHPNTAKDQTVALRHRTPEGDGLPIEIYLFSRAKDFAGYENFQNEVFEHLLAIMPQFDLKVFQSPSGYDLIESQGIRKQEK